MRRIVLVLLVALASALPALAQEAHDPAGHDAATKAVPPVEPMPEEPASSFAYRMVMLGMMRDMTMEWTGDADVDFVRGMIPHHQGAIDMAKVVLEHGKDPEVRKLAEAIIKTQADEIAWMRGWLEQRAK